MTRGAIRIAAIAAFAFACWSPAALAEIKAVVHDINMETFVDNCKDMGGTAIEGESFAGCDLPSGTSVVCSFEPDGATGGLCESETRVASTTIKELLGGVLPNLVMGGSLTSSNSDGGGTAPGGGGGTVGGGGKGSHLPSPDGNPGVVGGGGNGPIVK